MVTRKTRVLSAFAAFLMLVSLFTCIVLPAAAEAPTSYADLPAGPMPWPEVDLVPYASRTDATDEAVKDANGIRHYAITNSDDWMAAVAANNATVATKYSSGKAHTETAESFKDVILWFTNDVDFSGVTQLQDSSLTNAEKKVFTMAYYVKMSEENYLRNGDNATKDQTFQGTIYGQGYAVKNFNLDVTYALTNGNYRAFGFIGTAKNALIRDLTIDSSCSFAVHATATKDTALTVTVGAFAGDVYNSTFINCRNEADVSVQTEYHAASYATAFGFQGFTMVDTAKYDPNLDFMGENKIIDCINTGDLTSVNSRSGATSGAAVFSAALQNNPLYIYNCYNTGALLSNGSTEDTGLISAATAADAENITAKNLYSVNTAIGMGDNATAINELGTTLEAGTDASGELAYNLNVNYTPYEAGAAKKYYTVVDGETVNGTAENQTVRAMAVMNGTEIGAKYVSMGTEIDVAEMTATDPAICTYEASEGTITDGKLVIAPTSEDLTTVITVTSQVVDETFVENVRTAKADIEAFISNYGAAIDYFAEKDVILGLPAAANAALALAEGSDVSAANEALATVLETYVGLTYAVNGKVPYKYSSLEKFASVTDWAITDAADWKAAVDKGDYAFAGETLTLTNDIDLGDEEILPLSFGGNFSGTLDGGNHVIKGLNVVVETTKSAHRAGLVCSTSNAVIKNIGVVGKVTVTSASARTGIGGIAGYLETNSKLLHSWADVDVTLRNVAEGTTSGDDFYIGGLVGRGAGGSVIDGCYFLGNVDSDQCGYVGTIDGWGSSTISVYNSFDYSQNVVTRGDRYAGAVRVTNSLGTNKFENDYSIGRNVVWYANTLKATDALAAFIAEVNDKNGNRNVEEYESGELAWKLNSGAVDKGNGITYYTVADGKTVFGDETNYTCRIALVDGDVTMYVYGNKGTTVMIGGENYTFGTDETVTVEGLAHECTGTYHSVPEKYIATRNGDTLEAIECVDAHYTYCKHTTDALGVVAYCEAESDYVRCAFVEELTIKPDCTEPGEKTFTCECGATYTEVVEALGHTEEEIPAVAPTVDETGLTAGMKCSVCDAILTPQEILPVIPGLKLNIHEAEKDSTVAVDILLKNNPGIVGTQLNLTFDSSALEVKEILAGELFSVMNEDPVFSVDEETGLVTVTFTAIHTEDIKEDGIVATFVFNILTDKNDVPFTVCSTDTTNMAGVDVELAAAEGAVSVHKHVYTETVTKETSCAEPGIMTYTCTCNFTFTEEIPALPHTEEIDEAVAPDCINTGLTEGKHCSVCNKVIVEQNVADALGHTEVIDEAVAPDCINTGLSEGKHCSVCNKVIVEQNVVDALGHTEAIDEAVAPDCTNTGLTEGKHCFVCNEVLDAQEIVDALGHTEAIDEAVAPDCTNTGLTEGKHCSVCNKVLDAQETVAALGHTEVIDEAKAPTSTETGLTEGKHCSVCNAILVPQEVVPATGYTVTFDTAGGSAVAAQTVQAGQKATKPADPTKAGYDLAGWTLSGEAYSFDAPVNGNITLVANWKKVVDSSETFVDVPADAWYKEYVDYAVTYKILNGAGNKMNPDANITRAEFVQVLANLSGVDTSDKNVDAGFNDVKSGDWFAPAVKWASENAIAGGMGGGKFAPNESITREQMCTMLVRYIENYLHKELKKTVSKKTFADDAKISDWAKEYVYDCQQAGLVNGVTATKFAPEQSADRASIATLMTRFHKSYMK